MTPARSSGRGSKRRRISRSAEFERVYRQGRSHANRWFVVYAFPRAASEEAPRLGLSVSRRVGGAVERNRIKRLVREAFWAEADRLACDADYVVVARPDARLLGDQSGLTGVREALNELLDRHREPGTKRRGGPASTQQGGSGAAGAPEVPARNARPADGPGREEHACASHHPCSSMPETRAVGGDRAVPPTGETDPAMTNDAYARTGEPDCEAPDDANAPTGDTDHFGATPDSESRPEDR